MEGAKTYGPFYHPLFRCGVGRGVGHFQVYAWNGRSLLGKRANNGRVGGSGDGTLWLFHYATPYVDREVGSHATSGSRRTDDWGTESIPALH